MSILRRSILIVLLLAPVGVAEESPPVDVARVEAILASARPHLVAATGLPWPDGLVVERTDPAGLKAILRSEFEAQVTALYPDRPDSSRRMLVNVLVDTFARVVRAKYGLESKKIHVCPGALERLPDGVTADDALVVIVVHEAVHAMDDAAIPLGERFVAAAAHPEALRALRMVVEGRAEYYSEKVIGILGVEPVVARRLAANRDPGERLTREAGARFVKALAARDPELAVRALREPPATTSVIFHPDRFGQEPADGSELEKGLAKALPGARPSPLSELLLRRRFLERMGSESVERAFSGFLTGRTAEVASGRRVSLVRCESDEAAKRFLAGLCEFENAKTEKAVLEGLAPPGDSWPVARKPLRAPDGRLFRWAAAAAGSTVGEALSPDDDPLPLLAKALFLEKN
jgi:hypothetical protein